MAINYFTNHNAAKETAKLIHEIRPECRVCLVQGNVGKFTEVQNILDTVQHKLGTVSVLVNNAGVAPYRPVDELTEADFDSVIETNLKVACVT